jgi:hypothetical protein
MSVILLALAFAVGAVTHGVANPHSMLKATMAAAVSSMSMSGDCDRCGDNSKDMAAACAVFCNSAVASLAATVVVGVVLIGILRPSVAPVAIGHITPPDPYPPRPVSLS